MNIPGYHFDVLCGNRKHINFADDSKYFGQRPFWKHGCQNSFTDYQVRQLENFADLIEMKCECTEIKRCKLCRDLSHCEISPYFETKVVDAIDVVKRMSHLESSIIKMYCFCGECKK